MSHPRPLSRPTKGDQHDWIPARATIIVGGFHGSIDFMLWLADLVRFHQQLKSLYTALRGEAEFTTMEGQVYLKLTFDGLGNMTVRGHLEDQAGMGNKLSFALALDQTYLIKTMDELEGAVRSATSNPPEPKP